jgi:hypothetical protein
MPLGDQVASIVQRASRGEAIPASELEPVRLKLNMAEAVLAIFHHIDPSSGEITSLRAAHTELDSAGIRLIDNTPDSPDEDATVKWVDADTRLALGTIGSYRNAAKDTATFDIYANTDHTVAPSFAQGILELAAVSKGATSNWATWLFLYANGDETGAYTVLDMNIGKAGAWVIPLKVIHNFTSRDTLFVLDCSKDTTGDPTGEEGMIYFNTFDNKIKMYADGAWRQLATW